MMYARTQKPGRSLTVLALFNQPYSKCMGDIQSAAHRNKKQGHNPVGITSLLHFVLSTCLKSTLLTNRRACYRFICICRGHQRELGHCTCQIEYGRVDSPYEKDLEAGL